MNEFEQVDVKEESKNKRILNLALQVGLSLLFVLCILLLRNFFKLKETIDKYKALSDAFTVVGILYICIGALILVSTKGFFDGFSYGMKCAAKSLIPFSKKPLMRYSEFKDTRKREKVNYFTFVIGLGLMIIAIIFISLFYTLY